MGWLVAFLTSFPPFSTYSPLVSELFSGSPSAAKTIIMCLSHICNDTNFLFDGNMSLIHL